MAVQPSKGPVPEREDRTQNRSPLGWIALVLATLVTTFFAMFLGGEAGTSLAGAQSAQEALDLMLAGLSPFLVVTLLVVTGVVAVAVPRAGAVYLLFGAGAVILMPDLLGLVVGAVWATAGALFSLGHPEPRRWAYWLAVGLPVLVALLTGAVLGIFFPGIE